MKKLAARPPPPGSESTTVEPYPSPAKAMAAAVVPLAPDLQWDKVRLPAGHPLRKRTNAPPSPVVSPKRTPKRRRLESGDPVKLEIDGSAETVVEENGVEDAQNGDGRKRCFDIPEAPTYRPTWKQWKDPIKYIESIREEAEKFGLCKIVPPKGWCPEFAIDPKVGV